MFLLKCVKFFCRQYFSPLNTLMRKGKDTESDPDPYLSLIDPDPGGPKTCGSRSGSGSGSPTLLEIVFVYLLQYFQMSWYFCFDICSCADIFASIFCSCPDIYASVFVAVLICLLRYLQLSWYFCFVISTYLQLSWNVCFGFCRCPNILLLFLQLSHVHILWQAMRRRVSQKRRCSRGSTRTTRSSCTRRCWQGSRLLPRGRVRPPHSSVWNKIQLQVGPPFDPRK